ncbi:MAG: hypothetical protein RSD57_18065 [Comamonas sp.]
MRPIRLDRYYSEKQQNLQIDIFCWQEKRFYSLYLRWGKLNVLLGLLTSMLQRALRSAASLSHKALGQATFEWLGFLGDGDEWLLGEDVKARYGLNPQSIAVILHQLCRPILEKGGGRCSVWPTNTGTRRDEAESSSFWCRARTAIAWLWSRWEK